MSSTTVLLYCTDGESSSRISENLSTVHITIKEVGTFGRAKEELLAGLYPVLLYRCNPCGPEFADLIQFVGEHRLFTKVIVNARKGTVEDAVQAIRAGASDFIVSDGYDARVVESVLRAATQTGEFPPQSSREEKGMVLDSLPVLIGKSRAISEIRSAASLVAQSQTTVLITGESGTGKEVIANLIHLQSSRSSQPFYALNCATLPKDIVENELFGHEKGAFTGALPKRAGCFELASGGTLFLDEIAEMSLETQAKLLRVLETQRFRRLGGKDEVRVDVRMIAATNKNVAQSLRSRELREDLYYRLSVIELYIPPLRDRKEDILPILDHFLLVFAKKYQRPEPQFTDECKELFLSYDWPGNVRELKNIVERALVICPSDRIPAHYLPQRLHAHVPTGIQLSIPLGCSTDEAEKILILQTLASAGNNKSKAANILGMSRKTLHKKLRSYSQELS